MYEQIGYTQRTFEYLGYYLLLINFDKVFDKEFDAVIAKDMVVNIIQSNSVSQRPLLDIHSLIVTNIVKLLLETEDNDFAKYYLKGILGTLRFRKKKSGMLPDANNSIESVIKYTVTGEKPVYYSDSTSPFLALAVELFALLDMEPEYDHLQKFIHDNKITLGLFIPHHGKNSTSVHLIEDRENDLEEQLFSKSVNDGYQVETLLTKNLEDDLSFSEFIEKMGKRKKEFEYQYRTDKAGYPFLRDLAHMYFKTPYFPDKWRSIDPVTNCQ